MRYRENMSEYDFIKDMMDIIGRPKKSYIEEAGKGVVDFCVEWPLFENLDRNILLNLLDYFGHDQSLIENRDNLVDILSDYEVPEGAYYESEGYPEDYPNDFKHFTREYDY